MEPGSLLSLASQNNFGGLTNEFTIVTGRSCLFEAERYHLLSREVMMNVALTYFSVPRLILSNRVIFHRRLTQTISQEFVSFPPRVLRSPESPVSPQSLLLLFLILMTFKEVLKSTLVILLSSLDLSINN